MRTSIIELGGMEMRNNCGIVAWDKLAGRLHGRTTRISLDTLAKLAQDNGFLLYPMRVPVSDLWKFGDNVLVHYDHHFETIKPTEMEYVRDMNDYLYILSPYIEGNEEYVVDEEEAKKIRGSGIGKSFKRAFRRIEKEVRRSSRKTERQVSRSKKEIAGTAALAATGGLSGLAVGGAKGAALGSALGAIGGASGLGEKAYEQLSRGESQFRGEIRRSPVLGPALSLGAGLLLPGIGAPLVAAGLGGYTGYQRSGGDPFQTVLGGVTGYGLGGLGAGIAGAAGGATQAGLAGVGSGFKAGLGTYATPLQVATLSAPTSATPFAAGQAAGTALGAGAGTGSSAAVGGANVLRGGAVEPASTLRSAGTLTSATEFAGPGGGTTAPAGADAGFGNYFQGGAAGTGTTPDVTTGLRQIAGGAGQIPLAPYQQQLLAQQQQPTGFFTQPRGALGGLSFKDVGGAAGTAAGLLGTFGQQTPEFQGVGDVDIPRERTEAGIAAERNVVGLLGKEPGSLYSDVADRYTSIQEQSLEKQKELLKDDITKRFQAQGLGNSGQLQEELTRVDLESAQQMANLKTAVAINLFNQERDLRQQLIGQGIAIDEAQARELLGYTGIAAEEAALKYGIEVGKVNSTRNLYAQLFGVGLQSLLGQLG